VTLLTLGVVGSSAKENEFRLPIHPEHIPHLDADLREQITLEHGYGERFGASDGSLAPYVAGFASRAEILTGSDVVLLPKPQHSDVAALGPGQVLWGWPHCVQDPELTQLAIDRSLTLLAFESRTCSSLLMMSSTSSNEKGATSSWSLDNASMYGGLNRSTRDDMS
jgi:alanine dehydrogenase